MPPDPAETRRRILNAFADYYGEHGTAEMEAVASAAGVSRSTVYRHFANTGEMLEAARQEGLAEGARLMERHLAAALRGDAGADLIDGVIALLAEVFRAGVPMGQVLRRDAGADTTIQGHYRRLADEVVRRAQADGTISPHLDPAAVYAATVGLCRALVVAVEAGEVSAEGATQAVTAWLNALRPTGRR